MTTDPRFPTRDDELVDSAMKQFAALRAPRRTPPVSGLPSSTALDIRGPKPSVTLRADSIPGYELLGERHRGGQGVVYEAIQLATRRRVAIKTLRAGADASPAQRQRFEREVEILSELRHPNVVTIHDSGLSGEQLYYVMEFIDGQPLDRISGTSVEAIIHLFMKVCDAVNAAHLRGVIHRDLKPGNVLIDAVGEPHVLDFGLAKLTVGLRAGDSEALSMTEDGHFVGSLLWSSPEQSDGSDAVDTRTDVYALGVLLYHALTGRFPFPTTGSLSDIARRIREAEPLPMNLASIAGSSDGTARSQRLRIDNELETIVRKCLQKDPQRRYQTAGGLRDDLRRYQNHEPLEAKRDSFAYVLRKQLRRNRLAVGAIGAVSAATLIGFGVSLAFWRQAAREAVRARAAERLAQQRLERAETASRMLKGMFGSIGEGGFRGRDVTVQQMIDAFSGDVLSKVHGQPELEATLRGAIADAYLNLGKYDLAEPHVERGVELAREVFGDQHWEFAGALNARGMLRHASGRFKDAERDYRAALEIAPGPEPEWRSLHGKIEYNLADMLRKVGRLQESETLYRAAIAEFREQPDERSALGSATRTLASLVNEMGRSEEAEALFAEAMSLLREDVGENHPRMASAQNDYAELLDTIGRPLDAIPLYEQALATYRRTFGDESPRVATVLGNIGVAYTHAGKVDLAREYCTNSLDLRRRVLPDGHLDVAFGANNLARVYEEAKEFAPAEALFREALAILLRHVPPTHANVVACKMNLIRALNGQRKYAETADLYADVITARRKTLPADSLELATLLAGWGSALLDRKAFADAEPPLREALQIRKNGLPADSWLVASAENMLGGALLGLGRPQEAEPLLLPSYSILRVNADVPRNRLRDACERIVRYYEQIGDTAQAARWATELSALPK